MGGDCKEYEVPRRLKRVSQFNDGNIIILNAPIISISPDYNNATQDISEFSTLW